MKFFERFKTSSFFALLIIGIAPSDLRSFSATLRVFIVSFYARAIPRHSPPSDPRSLSFRLNTSRVLFHIKSAEMQIAP